MASKKQDADKLAAAQMAVREVKAGMKLGVGSGSTLNMFVEELGRKKYPFPVVCASNATEQLAKKSGLKTTTLDELVKARKSPEEPILDLFVDGADEVDKSYNLIKGGGGALTREKIIASASSEFACIVDESKIVAKIGKYPLPIEVIPFAVSFVSSELVELGASVIQRPKFITDNGNPILDVTGLDYKDPLGLETELNNIPGVVENGIFAVRQPEKIIVAKDGKARYL
ncbi:MAG: ribose-5-phosphate isomerase RpiA [Candidatus Altiarchaeota archaeon]|nr:ribose-5-phosphate isomerase RpiA [Candidatus Altiarchaeota archaeon]